MCSVGGVRARLCGYGAVGCGCLTRSDGGAGKGSEPRDAHSGNKRKYFPKRRDEKTWLLAPCAHRDEYEREVGITEEAHRLLPCDAALQCERGVTAEDVAAFDLRKIAFYTNLIVSTIAAHCSEEDEDAPPITAEQITAASTQLLVARKADPTCDATTTYCVNFTCVAKDLRMACGASSTQTASGNGGQVVTNILVCAGMPCGLLVPVKRVCGVCAQRCGAKVMVMADGRKERAPQTVTTAAAKAELHELRLALWTSAAKFRRGCTLRFSARIDDDETHRCLWAGAGPAGAHHTTVA